MAKASNRRPWITGGSFLLIGALLAIGGVWLIAVGGSWYYLLAGIGVGGTGVLVLMRRIEALWLYALVLLGTVVWALAEVGLKGWELEPRLLAPLVLGIWLLLPWVRRKLVPGRTVQANGPQASSINQNSPLTRYATLAPTVAVVLAAVVLGLSLIHI